MAERSRNITTTLALYAGISAGVLFLTYLFLGRAAFRYEERLKKEFRSAQAQLQEAEDLIRSLPNPQKAIEELNRKVQEFRDAGISGKQLPRIIKLLVQAAQEDPDIEMSSIRPREDIQGANENLPAGISKVYIEMVFTCSYKSLGDHLKRIVDLPGGFTVESVSLQRREDSVPASRDAKSAERKNALHVELLVSTFTVWEL